jgi:hypothetical protein
LQLWERGEEVRGWARYWKQLYEWLADRLAENERLREAALVVRFEDLCSDSIRVLTEVLEHSELYNEQLIARHSERLHAPAYYRPEFSAAEEAIIAEETAEVAGRFGYAEADAAVTAAG